MLSFHQINNVFIFRFPLLNGKTRTIKTDCRNTAQTIFEMFPNLKDLNK